MTGGCDWSTMETMVNVWAVVEHVRVASGAAELAIFTAILYWFFTSRYVKIITQGFLIVLFLKFSAIFVLCFIFSFFL